MHTRQERGIALVLALFLMSALSVLAASLMFLSQTETYSSLNYRMMSQARYAAESGAARAGNFLLDSAQYAMPGTLAGDPLTNYDFTKSPVVCTAACPNLNQPVVLSAMASKASNYPTTALTPGGATVVNAFNTAAQGTLTAGNNATLTYGAYATLLTMEEFDSYGGGKAVVQTWQVTADGNLTGARTATVEVVATIEQPKAPAYAYAAFATDNHCSSLYFHGHVSTDSYDSTNLAAGAGSPGTVDYNAGGDVGTFGNLNLQGTPATIGGNLYTPRTGVGSCTNGADGADVGLSETGHPTVHGSEAKLPQTATFPSPTFSSTPPTNTVTIDSSLLANAATACSALGLTSGTNCTVNAGTKTVTVNGGGFDVTMPSVNVASGYTLIFAGNAPLANTVNINSVTGSGSVKVNANLGATDTGESVVLKIAAKNPDGSDMAIPFDLTQLATALNTNFQYDASSLQIVYGGAATFSMSGNTQFYSTLYAPNASVTLLGTVDWYGSVLAKTIEVGGTANIHYDRKLQRDFWVPGMTMLSTFSWNRY